METFYDVISRDRPVLVDFFATWCQPCRAMHPVLEQVKAELGDKLRIIKIDVDKNEQTAGQYGIQAVPTLLLMRNRQVLWRQSGMISKAGLIDALTPFLQ